MKVLVIGCSHVERLGADGTDFFDYRGSRIFVYYHGIGGADFQTYTKNNNAKLISVATRYNPDIIITFIGGNAIKTTVTNQEIYDASEGFHRAVSGLFPGAIIVASQIEVREYKPNNRWNCPIGYEHHRRRVAYNNFLKALIYKDHLMMINGPGAYRMDDPKIYSSDKVHFKPCGYLRLYNIIKKEIKYVIREHFLL